MVPCFPLLGLTPSGLFMGLSSTIIYTSELILCSTICVPSAKRHNIHMYPYFLFAAIYHLKSSPTFYVRPCSSVGRVTEDLTGGRGFDSHRGQKIFSFPRVVPCFSLLGLTPSGLFMGLSSTIIYTSELILCSTICVPSATRHNIHILIHIVKVQIRFYNIPRFEGKDPVRVKVSIYFLYRVILQNFFRVGKLSKQLFGGKVICF